MSTDCDRYQELASALTDGCLEADGIAELQGHLRTCSECRLFMSRAYRTRDLLRAEEAREAPFPVSPGFAAAVAARVARERVFPAPSTFSDRLESGVSLARHFMTAAAAAVLLLTAGWSSYRFASRNAEPTVVASSTLPRTTEEGSMASYFREYALQTMDATFLGLPQGLELADFETPGRDVE